MITTDPLTRLDFALPPFMRVLYPSDAAQKTWEDRLWRINHAWNRIQRQAVLDGARPAATITTLVRDLPRLQNELAPAGLVHQSLPGELIPADEWARIDVLIGPRESITAMLAGWAAGDHAEIGAALGYPACCAAAYATHAAAGWSDPVWPLIAQAADESAALLRDTTGDWRTNPLLNRLGARAIPHIACAAGCADSLALADALIAVGRGMGYHEEMDWLRDVLSWPVEWTALHGIAEVKTPLFKFIYNTDATAEKLTVRRQGTRYPDDAPQGLSFPYQRPDRLRITDSRSYQRGLAHHNAP